MNPNILVCCLYLLLGIHSLGSKPVSDLKILKQLLAEENTVPPYSEGAMDVERKDGDSEKSLLMDSEGHPWDSYEPSNWALVARKNVLAHLLKDLARTSKRSWSRYKKGGMRSCFGVRLDRIGSFSGLGC